MGGGDDGLRVTVGDRFSKSLTCEIGVEVRNWHLVMGGLSRNGEETVGVSCQQSDIQEEFLRKRKAASRPGGASTADMYLHGISIKKSIAGSFDSYAVKQTR